MRHKQLNRPLLCCRRLFLTQNIYNIFVDGLISILQLSGIGCYVRKIFAAALGADDVCIVTFIERASTAAGHLQFLLLSMGHLSKTQKRLKICFLVNVWKEVSNQP